jgi:excinuclease ABC subunit C
LDEIEGVGKKKRLALIQEFGTIDKIMNADLDKLAKVDGIGEKLAIKIINHLKENLNKNGTKD